MGKFSSDHLMRAYWEDVWWLKPFPANLDELTVKMKRNNE